MEGPHGPFLNDPHRKAGRFRIEKQVIKTIRHTRRGAIIRIAVYSFDRMPVTDAPIAAHRRGVTVQMLLNDHQDTKAMQVIRAEIGTNRSTKNFIYTCVASCRSTENEFNNLHSKFSSFAQSGKSKDVAVGSTNMMLNAALHQWNDLYFGSGDHILFRKYVSLFNNMKKDFDKRRPPRFFCGTPLGPVCDDSVDKHTVWALPKLSGPRNDLVLDMLGKIKCLTPDGAGGVTRTRLALSMHTMRGRRGDHLATAIRNKDAEGCDFRVSYGLIGYHTKQILANDELWLTVRGRRVARKYVRNFDYQWDHARTSRDAYTTTNSTFRVPRMERQPDGTMARTYATVRRPVTTVEPDGYSKGPYWEAD